MTPDEVAVYYDDPNRARSVCDLLERAHPGWAVRRENRVWRARYETWPEGLEISDANAGLLDRVIRLGGTLP